MAKPVISEQMRKDTEEFNKLLEKQPRLLRSVSGIWESIKTSIIDSGDKLSDTNKSSKTFKDISKKILANTEDIHKANVNWADITKQINKATKEGNSDLAKRYKHMQAIQNIQKRYNNVVNAGANSLSKMVSSLESTIRGLPFIGDFISDAIDFDDLNKKLSATFRAQFEVVGEGMRGGIVEGATSGYVEANRPFQKMIARVRGTFGKNKTFKGWNDFQKSFKGTGASSKDMSKAWKDWGKNASQAGRGLGGVGKLLAKGGLIGAIAIGVSLLGKMVASSVQFAFQSGISLKQAKDLGPALLINKKYVEAMAEEFGTINDVNAKIAGKLKFQELKYGIQSDQAVKILRIQTAISGQTSEQLINIQSAEASLARAAGVLPVKLFEDIAQNMEYFAKSAKDGGANVMKTATAAAKLGLNLSVVDQIATHLLDIEGSINAQFEANAVLGKNMNFDRARSLVLAGKDHLLLAEIKKQVGGEAEFNKMNRIERELLSKAIGSDVTNLAKIATEQDRTGAKAKKGMTSATMWWMGIGAALLGALAFFTLPFSGAAAIGAGALGVLGGATLGGLAGATFLPQFATLPPGRAATIDRGSAIADAGETIVRTESINLLPLIDELKALRKDFNSGQGKTNRYLSELG